MIVTKFGGTSVADATNISLVLEIVLKKAETEKVIVVVSAFSGVTDLLLRAAQKASSKDIDYKNIVQNLW